MSYNELSIRDIRTIGAGRYGRKLYKSAVFWVLLVMAFTLVISGAVMSWNTDNPQYTLPSGEVVELEGGKLVIEDTISAERDNPIPTWSLPLALMVVALGILVYGIVYISIQEEKARDKIMEEWIAAGYQPKAKDV